MREGEERMCVRRDNKWYCVSPEEYKLNRFANATPVESRRNNERLDNK